MLLWLLSCIHFVYLISGVLPSSLAILRTYQTYLVLVLGSWYYVLLALAAVLYGLGF